MTKDTDDNEKKVALVLMSLLAVIAIFGVGRYIIQQRKMNQGSVYILGIVTKFEPGKYGGKYQGNFTFKGKKYPTSFRAKGSSRHPGDYFFVQIPASDPDYADYLPDEPVPACVTLANMPPEGWKTLPSYCENPCDGLIRLTDWQEYRFKSMQIHLGLINSYVFHSACRIRQDTAFANVFKCIEPTSRDTILVFILCKTADDFSVPPYDGPRILTLDSSTTMHDYPPEVVTPMEKQSPSGKYKYLVIGNDAW